MICCIIPDFQRSVRVEGVNPILPKIQSWILRMNPSSDATEVMELDKDANCLICHKTFSRAENGVSVSEHSSRVKVVIIEPLNINWSYLHYSLQTNWWSSIMANGRECYRVQYRVGLNEKTHNSVSSRTKPVATIRPTMGVMTKQYERDSPWD